MRLEFSSVVYILSILACTFTCYCVAFNPTGCNSVHFLSRDNHGCNDFNIFCHPNARYAFFLNAFPPLSIKSFSVTDSRFIFIFYENTPLRFFTEHVNGCGLSWTVFTHTRSVFLLTYLCIICFKCGRQPFFIFYLLVRLHRPSGKSFHSLRHKGLKD